MKIPALVSKNIIAVLTIFLSLGLHSGIAMSDDSHEEADVSRGARAWANNCTRCHNLREPVEFRDDLWKPIVTHMRIRAGLTGKETRDIIVFLQASNSIRPISSVKPASSPGQGSGKTAIKENSGKEIYQQTCIACHGADGKGVLPGAPNLTDKSGPFSKSDSELLRNIVQGYQGPTSPMAMPPKGGNPELTREDMKRVLAFMRKEFGN
ncbi:MAG: hypothetical protein BMS9Abin26_2051 [Gammaproteobacteria bacterium]|nr:MAG: hypothetical protein BMS9Abin26_2051 [Gammaproteobacteria bacterium]